MHSLLVEMYGVPDALSFLGTEIDDVVTETPFYKVFPELKTKRGSEKTPDICAFDQNHKIVYIGEIKGQNDYRNIMDARNQLYEYLKVLRRNSIPAEGFIIVGDYIEIIKTRCCAS
ncbi:Uncharacterised protein [uncultured archaeon]|nr:Uncharacterised protein [uncultured archaeon]